VIRWSDLAAADDSYLNGVPSEFQVNEVFITDGGGGVAQTSVNSVALGIGETYSTS
jgi:hypothetical protein